ncbi:MAG: protease modulator HflC, partial [Hyphomicrobiaceae bacterium]
AAEIRAQGEEVSRRIRATADHEVTVVKAEATRESEIMRGDGEAQRTKILADAFGQDPDFFTFYRSMQAYEKGLQAKDTRLVISPNTDFFRFFHNPAGTAGASSSAKPGSTSTKQ